MLKIAVGAFVGIFIGAFVVEVLNRQKPELTKKIEDKAKKSVNAFFSAFREGYVAHRDQAEPKQA